MRNNFFFKANLYFCALICASVLLFIIYFLIKESLPLLQEEGVGIFLVGGWHPLEGEYALVSMLMASLYIATGAIMLATPLGISLAIFGQFYCSKAVALLYRNIIDILAGVPSVVFGLWGLTVLVPWFIQFNIPGASLFTGIIVLALMVLPLVVITTDAALKSVPEKYIQSAQALGLSRWGIIYKILLPVALPGILSGIILQSGRALGETMAILMVTGNVVQLPTHLFQPVRTLTANIALEMAYAVDHHRIALFTSGLVLLLVTIIIVILAHQLKEKNDG